jgi:hypothetical protein
MTQATKDYVRVTVLVTLFILALVLLATQAIGAGMTPKAAKKSVPVNAKQSWQLTQITRKPGPSYNITTLSVVWDFLNDGHTSFWVYSSQDISKPKQIWPLKAIVATNGLPVKLAVGGHEFYAVRASNSVYKTLSDYAVTKPMKPRLYQP